MKKEQGVFNINVYQGDTEWQISKIIQEGWTVTKIVPFCSERENRYGNMRKTYNMIVLAERPVKNNEKNKKD